MGNQRKQLLGLIREREAIITSKASDPRLPLKKANAWREVTALFNAGNPGQEPRTVKQIKRAWEHIKRK